MESNRRDRERPAVYAGWLAASAAVLLPLCLPPYLQRTGFHFLFFLVLCLSFHLLGGLSGFLNLGQGLFVGLGAYSFGLCSQAGVGAGWAFTAAIGGSVLTGLMLAPLLFRLEGAAFALANLALVYVAFSVTHLLRPLTGGADGLYLGGGGHLDQAMWGQAALAGVVGVLTLMLPGSRMGHALKMIGVDPLLAESIGIDTLRVEIALYALCAVFLGGSGALFALSEGYLIPENVFGLQVSLLPVAMAMVGGLGNRFGPFLGTGLVFGLQEWIWVGVGSMEQTLLGGLLIAAGKGDVAFALLRRTLRRRHPGGD